MATSYSNRFDERMKQRAALEKQPVTAEEKARWAPMLHSTWHAIGGDVEENLRYSRQRLTKGIVVEMVVDANRVMDYGGMTREEYEFMCVAYHRPAFKRWLYKELNYA